LLNRRFRRELWPVYSLHRAANFLEMKVRFAGLYNSKRRRVGLVAVIQYAKHRCPVWAGHVDNPDVVAVAMRLAPLRLQAVWRCAIDGPLLRKFLRHHARARRRSRRRVCASEGACGGNRGPKPTGQSQPAPELRRRRFRRREWRHRFHPRLGRRRSKP